MEEISFGYLPCTSVTTALNINNIILSEYRICMKDLNNKTKQTLSMDNKDLYE